tara:strand:+ start:240 stop:410 length:171 start_codon:yes stop_codon:yes gene_type:complete
MVKTKKKLIKYDEFRKWLMTCPVPYYVEELLDFDDDSICFYTKNHTDKFKDNKEGQ